MSNYQDPVEMLALEMRDRLAAATAQNEAMRQRAEAAERDCATVMEQRENWRRRAEAAEAKLTDVDNYGVEQWNRGLSEGDNGDCQTFQEWLQSRV